MKYVIFIAYMWPLAFALTEGTSYPYVTCGSVLKLQNTKYKNRLHSHEIKYGSGSGQQSVTGTAAQDDINSHWVVKGKMDSICTRGEPVACGSVIRLEHLATKKNLHSHHFSSPLSSNQEVSAFGDQGVGDTGDNWTLVCNTEYWERSGTIRLKHVDTEAWLSVSGHTYGQPISGQSEICGLSYPDGSSYWKAAEGVFIKPTDTQFQKSDHEHTEL